MDEWCAPGFVEIAELGRGGFGRAVLVREPGTGGLRVLKYALAGGPVALEAFRRESTLLKGVDSPYVARWYGHLEHGPNAAILMEAVPGITLRTLLAERGTLVPEAALAVLKGSLLGLAAAHERGVVHRDYKPGNVMVQPDGTSKLIDFGIAGLTGETVAAGSARYMAPEQRAGLPTTPATDVYSATCVFYECLTGTPPTPPAEPGAPAAPADPTGVAPGHSPSPGGASGGAVAGPASELRELVARGLAADPGVRPGDARVLAEELDAVAGHAYGPDWEARGWAVLKAAALTLAALAPLAVAGSAASAVGVGAGSGGIAAGSAGPGGGGAGSGGGMGAAGPGGTGAGAAGSGNAGAGSAGLGVGAKVGLAVSGVAVVAALGVVGVKTLGSSSSGEPRVTVSPAASAKVVADVREYQAPAGAWVSGTYVIVSGMADPAVQAKVNAALRKPLDDEAAAEQREAKEAGQSCKKGSETIKAAVTLQRATFLSVSYQMNLDSCLHDLSAGSAGVNLDLTTGQALAAKDIFLPVALTTQGVQPLIAGMSFHKSDADVDCETSDMRSPKNFLDILTAAPYDTGEQRTQGLFFTKDGVTVWYPVSHTCFSLYGTAPFSAVKALLKPEFAQRTA